MHSAKSLFRGKFGLAISSVHIFLNGKHYRSRITNFFWPALEDLDTYKVWFQQDGARQVICLNMLHVRFLNIVVLRGSDVNWLPR